MTHDFLTFADCPRRERERERERDFYCFEFLSVDLIGIRNI